MKFLKTTLIATVISATAFAQNADKALARVRYTLSHMRDTTQRNDLYTENMLLVIGKNASVFTSYDKINRDLEIRKSIEEQLKNQAGNGNINISRSSSKPVTAIDYFYFANENKFFTKERLITNYLIEEDAPKINWKIGKDTASFSGVKCQKAIADFKGRKWIAWFAPELPFQSGPWKLNGLPGLIIEAHDDKNEVKFQFAGIDKVEGEAEATKENEQTVTMPNGNTGVVKFGGMDGSSYLGNEIKLPNDAVKTTQKELDKLKAARDKDPQGFMNAQMGGRGFSPNTTVTRSVTVNSAPSGVKKTVINNPIELPEKK